MFERLISGPARTNLSQSVGRWAKAEADARGLTLVIVTHGGMVEQWQQEIGPVETMSWVAFDRLKDNEAQKRLYVINLDPRTMKRLAYKALKHQDPVWVMSYHDWFNVAKGGDY